jgi:general secretion pathway protein D
MVGVLAISAPVSMPLGLIVPAAVVATVTFIASDAVAQSPSLLPPSLPPAQSLGNDGLALPPAIATNSESTPTPKSLLIKARTALSEGKQEAAAQALAQATMAAQNAPEMAAELQQTRNQFLERGVNPQTLDKAFAAVQPASNTVGSRAANALRNRTAGNTTQGSTAVPSMLPPLPASSIPSGIAAVNAQANLPPNALRDQAVGLTAQAKMALDRGDVASAKSLIEKANSLRVPDSEFGPGQTRPWSVALDVDRAERLRSETGVTTASASAPLPMETGSPNFATNGGVQHATAQMLPNGVSQNGMQPNALTRNSFPNENSVQPGLYQPANDQSRVAPASGVLSSYDSDETGVELYNKGLKALSAGNKEAALNHFKGAWQKQADLDPGVRTQLKDKLNLLSMGSRQSGEPESIDAATPESRENQIKQQRWYSEVTGEIADAERMAGNNQPMEALDKLKSLRLRVSQADIDSGRRKNLLTMVDKVSIHMQKWAEDNKSTIELDQRNKQIEDKIQQDAITETKTDIQVQGLVEQYNELMKENRYHEAVAVATKVAEIKPNSEIASILYHKAKIQTRVEETANLRDRKQDSFADAMFDVDKASDPFSGDNPLKFGPVLDWARISKARSLKDELPMTPHERKIRESLGAQFSASFDRRPLADAMKTISEMTGIPIVLDDRSIAEEGITVDQPITLDLNGNSISLKSALNIMLERLNLTYSVKNEVLTIESARFNKKELKLKTYNVKDLVIPIPNFVSDYNTGMAGALQSAYTAQTHMASALIQEESVASAASRIANIDPNSAVLAQVNALNAFATGMSPGALASGLQGGLPNSSAGLGGAAIANYQSLINLIERTITPDKWEAAGGDSNMLEFRQNLSLVVTAPQETHEAIADLLKSLRALQNLQVTIEVRFIQLEDTFFERIGVDFDFNINDKVNRLPRENGGQKVAVGLNSITGATGPNFTQDLDLHLRNNFNVTPPAGRPDQAASTSIGLAILSDLELFFFLEAAQGNSRSNVLQAPKVTMFDGQNASINDFTQRPFVLSYEPVVGDFAVAQRPIVVVLNEGTQMNVQSVVSQDKRFVRLTLVPQFTRIEAADQQFTFTGRTSTATGTSILNNGLPTNVRDNQQNVTEGTTVQQPTLGTTSVTTTVSVPDGGTILLGGIKRLREARTERGTPILSKIPYLNRLFKNNAIGRETNTLMMTVTPRIIIPEEEEELLGVSINNRP